MNLIRCGIAFGGAAACALLLATPAAAKQTRWVDAGPIWNQMDADRKCPNVARDVGGKWTGEWKTTEPGRMSVCEVAGGSSGGGGWGKDRWVEAGPIWNNFDADRKCSDLARHRGGKWTGQWKTTVPGQMSVCEIAGGRGGGGGGGLVFNFKDKWVEAGPIWNNMDADRKCSDLARRKGGKWTGEWKTTIPGQMSVCEIKK